MNEALLASYRHDRRGSAKTIIDHTVRQLTDPPSPLSLEEKLEVLRLTQLALLQGLRNADTERIGKALWLNSRPIKRRSTRRLRGSWSC